MDRLFVYGSLKAGGSAHLLLNGALAEAGGTLEHVDLIEFDAYPMLRAGSARVDGEVYRIPDSLWPALLHSSQRALPPISLVPLPAILAS